VVRFRTPLDARVRVGAVDGEWVRPLSTWTLEDSAAASVEMSAAADTGLRLAGCQVLAPIPRPGKIFGSGINYASHLAENPAAQRPSRPTFFLKMPTSVVGPGTSIVIPTPATRLDYEVELAVIVGRTGKDLRPGNAMAHVAGYTVVNDVSARDLQQVPGLLDLAKGCDTFCPMGPVLVTVDEIDDPRDLTVRSWVNGELRQEAAIGDLLFDVATLLCAASAHTTLEPGDVVMTRTPAGSGAFRDPPVWLAPGDVVTVAVEGIGELTNPVVAGWETRAGGRAA
jgi:2-keto-4-pentenoate hydratase/2-oxohepta-3-ene-1,7-dioic acid hydratase in catechol pathway